MGIEDRMAEAMDRRRVWGYTDDEKFNSEIARAWKKSAFNPHDFAPKTYSREEVSFDEARVAKIKKSPDYVHERGSETVALEYVLMEAIKVHGWFGDSVISVRKTAEYDDVFSGADFVVTFEDEDTGEFFNLGIDATTSADRAVIDRKEEKIIRNLSRGEMTGIKYFEDPDGNRGPAFMPRIILGLDAKNTLEMQKLFVESPDKAEYAREATDFLESAGDQLLHFINYVLHRSGLLGEGREIKTVEDGRRFLNEHKDEVGEKTLEILEKHLVVLGIVADVLHGKKIARKILAIAG